MTTYRDPADDDAPVAADDDSLDGIGQWLRHVVAPWEGSATQRDGRRLAHARVDGVDVELEAFVDVVDGEPTNLRFVLTSKVPASLGPIRLSPPGELQTLAKRFFLASEHEVGIPELDERYWIRGDEPAVRAIIKGDVARLLRLLDQHRPTLAIEAGLARLSWDARDLRGLRGAVFEGLAPAGPRTQTEWLVPREAFELHRAIRDALDPPPPVVVSLEHEPSAEPLNVTPFVPVATRARGRDDALYTLTDFREVAPVRGFEGRTDVMRALLSRGSDVRWVPLEPRGPLRSSGHVQLRGPHATDWGHEGSDSARDAFAITDPARAWAHLCRTPSLDPSWFADLTPRIDTPPQTFDDVLTLAKGFREMPLAEARVRELYERLAPFGGPPCPPIRWRTMTHEEKLSPRSSRAALTPLVDVLRRTIPEDEWHRIDTSDISSFIGAGRGSPGFWSWIAEDVLGLRRFDHARQRDMTTHDNPIFHWPLPAALFGVPLADVDSPWESLLRIGVLGFAAQLIDVARVVLVAV